MNKKNIIIVMIVIILITLGLVFVLFNKNTPKDKDDNDETNPKIEASYYEDMLSKMTSNYKLFFDNMPLPPEGYEVKVTLADLKRSQIDISGYVNYQTKIPCDLSDSYATGVVKDNAVTEISVYYSCGEAVNY